MKIPISGFFENLTTGEWWIIDDACSGIPSSQLKLTPLAFQTITISSKFLTHLIEIKKIKNIK